MEGIWRDIGGASAWVNAKDGIGGGYFGGEIQMGINVGCGGNIAVTQPLLNLLLAHPVGIQKAGAAVPEVVKPYPPHPMFFQKQGEMLGKIVRLYQFTHRIHIEILVVFVTVHLAAKFAVLLLLCLQPEKKFLERRDKGKGPAAGLRFGSVFFYKSCFSVDPQLCYRMIDGDSLFLKVDGVPP